MYTRQNVIYKIDFIVKNSKITISEQNSYRHFTEVTAA